MGPVQLADVDFSSVDIELCAVFVTGPSLSACLEHKIRWGMKWEVIRWCQ